MPLDRNSRIGSYEIVASLGAGGMGEVYRARDSRLDRDVAIKLLPQAFASDPERLQRFEHEARATAALNDPHIVAIFDVGTHDGQPYLVSEFVDGETLRTILFSGPLPPRKVISYARQIALGMAAAHRRGIVHRDLKPENLVVTREGHVKILDFGLAKLNEARGVTTAESVTTAPGVVLGTVGYMSPEQARGESSDERADIFSFGVVVHEMLTGRRTFRGSSPAETLSAILRDNPPDLVETVPGVPPGLARIVDHCLEKSRESRFQSAADLGFALDAISSPSVSSDAPPRVARRRGKLAATGVLLAATITGAFVTGIWLRPSERPQFHQLTFRRGTLQAARFSADGQTIIYAAAWEGRATELFSTLPHSPEARPLQMLSTGLFALSSRGDLALALEPHGFGRVEGTLARAALAGGPPRELADGVSAADWFPDGSGLAMAQSDRGRTVIEYPIGQTLYDASQSHVTHLRFSPSGDAIAVVVHPVSGDSAGSVVLLDLKGRARTLSSGWNSVLGLGWAPGGEEIWFTATRSGAAQALHAVTRSGEERLLFAAPATLTLHDVSRDGRALISRDAWGAGVMALAPGSSRERELSWLDGSMAWDISSDGTTVILEESWEGGGADRSIYLRTTDGGPAVRLGDGVPLALSPDKQWVLSTTVAADELVLLPTGVGQPRTLPRGNLASYFPSARWLPDGRRFLVSGSETSGARRVYLQSIDSGEPRPVTPEGAFGRIAVLQGGEAFVTRDVDRRLAVFSLQGAEPHRLEGAQPLDLPVVGSDDGDWLYVETGRYAQGEIARVHLRDGRREPLRSLQPPDPAGVTNVLRVVMTPDGSSYAYTFVRAISALYLVEGIE
jgi:serine/threonine protein kinase/Tol biopolymer transport system component